MSFDVQAALTVYWEAVTPGGKASGGECPWRDWTPFGDRRSKGFGGASGSTQRLAFGHAKAKYQMKITISVAHGFAQDGEKRQGSLALSNRSVSS
jgi:hypothetical protein